MVLKLWEVEKGRVIFLMHINSKNEKRLVKLKENIDYDNVQLLSDLDKAIELMTTFVTSVKKFSSTENDKVSEIKKLDETVEIGKLDGSLKADVEEEKWAWGNEETKKNVPEEVKDKLGALLERDIGNTRGAQYLIHKNKGIGTNKDENSPPVSDKTANVDTPKDGKVERRTGKKSGKRSKYYDVISKILPEILDGIEKSEDKTVTMKISDIVARMDEGISVSKSPGNVYTGLKLGLFAHNIVADRISIEGKGKMLIMRIRNEADTLPGYILRNRSKSRLGQ